MNDSTFEILAAREKERAQYVREQLAAMSDIKERKNNRMKISEMSTANFANFIETSGDSVANIMQNPAVMALFSGEKKAPLRWMLDAGKALLGPCKEDTFTVIGAMCGKSAEEIGKQNILVTLGMLRSIYEDLKSAEVPD